MRGWAIADAMPSPPEHRFRRVDGVVVAEWPAFDGTGLRAAVTARHGGVSTGPYCSLNLGLHVGDRLEAVKENRRRAAAAVGAAAHDLVTANQLHGREVAVVEAPRRAEVPASPVPDADALVTIDPDATLLIVVADCVPIVLWDPAAQVLACVHAGWRGTSQRVAAAAVDAMVALGARRRSILAGLGPAVDADAYQVGDEVAQALAAGAGAGRAPVAGDLGPLVADRLLRPDGHGRWLADLAGLNCRVLEGAGVVQHHLHRMDLTTGSNGAFFSARAEDPCGRFGLLARIDAAAGRRRGSPRPVGRSPRPPWGPTTAPPA